MTAPHHPTGLPHPAITRALEDVIRVRLAQIEQYGHTPQADRATGPARLNAIGYAASLKAAQLLTGDAAGLHQMAGDQLTGHLARLTDHDVSVVIARLTKSAAMSIAAADTLYALLAERNAEAGR